MNTRRQEYDIERMFDDETGADRADTSTSMLSGDAAAYQRDLERIRQGARTVVRREQISDAQFPAFMAGIQEGIEAPERSYRGVWAFVSLASAALIVAISTFAVIRGGTPDATATVVEEVTTEIEGATVHWETSEDGGATVWVDLAEGDLW